MNILVLGGTRFFGIPMVNKLISRGHQVTIATRGLTPDPFGNSVSRIRLDRSDKNSIARIFSGSRYELIIDKTAYSSNDIKRILDHAECRKYILMSSSAVYDKMHRNTCEDEFSPFLHELKWCERSTDYAESKRQAECALFQKYSGQCSLAVRYPVVLGKNDYTGRLRFYAEHIINQTPMFIDDMESKIAFIEETEAGIFLAHLAESDLAGAINGCSEGTASISDVVRYIENKTGKRAVISAEGDNAPYNGYPEYAALNTEKARSSGFIFSRLDEWLYKLIDHIIDAL